VGDGRQIPRHPTIAAVAAHSESVPPGVVAAAQERGRARDLIETLAELPAELEAAVDDEA